MPRACAKMRPNPDAHPLGGGADRPADVLAPETISAMHLSGMRLAPEFARGQLAAGVGTERTANAENNSPGRRHDGITELFARICGTKSTRTGQECLSC
jgi:hypothetical protein